VLFSKSHFTPNYENVSPPARYPFKAPTSVANFTASGVGLFFLSNMLQDQSEYLLGQGK
jgi:hypothetical protein